MKRITILEYNTSFKLVITFLILLLTVACQQREGQIAVDAFLTEMAPELAKKITEIEQEISLTEEKIEQLAELKLKHPKYSETIEKSRREWVHLQTKLKHTLKEIRDVVESTYVAYELDKIQGGKQFEQISAQLLTSANSVLTSATTTKGTISEALQDLAHQFNATIPPKLPTSATPEPSSSSIPIAEITEPKIYAHQPERALEIYKTELENVYSENYAIESNQEIEDNRLVKGPKPILSTATTPDFSSTTLPTKLAKVLRGHGGDVNAIVFSPNGELLASASNDNTVKLWNVQTGKELRTFQEAQDDVLTVAFNPNGDQLAAGGNEQTIKLWNLNTNVNPQILTGHEGIIHSLTFSPDGRTLVSGSWDKTIRLWALDSASELEQIQNDDSIYSVAFSPDGQLIACGSFNETITIWEANTGTLLRTLQGHGMRTVYAVAFHPNSHQIVSGDLSNNVRIWDTHTGDSIFILKGPPKIFGGIVTVTYHPNGRVIASGHGDKIKLWNATTGEELQTLGGGEESEVRTVAFSPDGQILASGYDDNTIKLWKIP
jgi:hypothetical protein